MSGLRQLVLVVSMVLAMIAQQHAGALQQEIACGAAADSAANKNTITATQAGGYAALVIGVLTAIGNRVPGVRTLIEKLGGPDQISRVVDPAERVIESRGRDLGALLDVAKLVFEKGNPQALNLLALLHQQLRGVTPAPIPDGEPPSRDECVAQLIRRIELDAAARISGETPAPPTLPFAPKVS